MADDVEALMLRIEASATKLEKDMAKANQIFDQSARRMERKAREFGQQIGGTLGASLMRSLTPALSGIGGVIATAISVNAVKEYADKWQSVGNAVAAVSKDTLTLSSSQTMIADMAIRARSPLEGAAQLYARMARSASDLGADDAQVAVATETILKSMKLTGATTEEAAAASLQLSQALQSGVLQGDELRTILEAAPVLARAIAREFGVGVGQLKQLGSEGQLVATRVFKAIVNSAADVNDAFARTKPTISDTFAVLETQAAQWVGTSSAVKTATAAVTSGIGTLGNNLDLVAVGAGALGAIIASRLVSAGLTPLVASLGSTLSSSMAAVGGMNEVQRAIVFATARAHVGTLAIRGLGAAMSAGLALVGGPIGAVLLGVAAATAYLTERSVEAEERNRLYATSFEEVRRKAEASTEALDRNTAAVVENRNKKAVQDRYDATKDLSTTEADIRAARDRFRFLIATAVPDGAAAFGDPLAVALDKVAKEFDGTSKSAEDTKVKLLELATLNPDYRSLVDSLTPLLTTLINASAHVDLLKAKISSIPPIEQKERSTDKLTPSQATAQINAIPQPALKDPSLAATEDPVVKLLVGQGITQRAVADAEMDETEKKVKDRAKKLYDDISKAGGSITMSDATASAKRIVAAEDAKKGGDKKDELQQTIQKTREHTDALYAEAAAVGLDAEAKARMKTEQELVNAAKRAGKDLTPDVIKSIEEEAAANAAAAAFLEKKNEAHKAQIDLQRFAGESLAGFFSDIVSGGKNAQDALMNLTKKLADAALQAALLGSGPLASLFGTKASGDNVGGLIGALFKGFGFADGGYTGDGGRLQPAGIVHRGEYVMDAATVKKIGIGNLDAMRAMASRGYAAGGAVTGSAPRLALPSMPSLPTMKDMGRSGGATVSIGDTVINAPGADAAAISTLRSELAARDRALPAQIVAAIRDAKARGVRGI